VGTKFLQLLSYLTHKWIQSYKFRTSKNTTNRCSNSTWKSCPKFIFNGHLVGARRKSRFDDALLVYLCSFVAKPDKLCFCNNLCVFLNLWKNSQSLQTVEVHKSFLCLAASVVQLISRCLGLVFLRAHETDKVILEFEVGNTICWSKSNEFDCFSCRIAVKQGDEGQYN